MLTSSSIRCGTSPLWRVVLIAALALLQSAEFPALAQTASERALVWPPAPAAARIRYVRSIATPADWGVTPGMFARLIDSLTGSTPITFVRPTGVASRDGLLFVADPGAAALFVFDAGRGEARKVTGSRDAALVSPVAVALGPADTVFVADSALGAVFAFDRNGNMVRRIANEKMERPAGVVYDSRADRLYVADSHAHRIVVFSAAGALLQTFGRRGSADGEFNAPTHLALTTDGKLLVTDALNHRIQAFDASGRFLWKIGSAGDGSGAFAAPKGVAVDSAAHVYAADALFDAVQIFRSDGALLLGFGGRGTRPGQFSLPGGLYMDADDRLYVADSFNRRIQVFERVKPAPGASDD